MPDYKEQLSNGLTAVNLLNPVTQLPTISSLVLTPLWRKFVTDKMLNAAGSKMSPEGELVLRSVAAGALNAGDEQVEDYSKSVKGGMGWENAEDSWGGAAPYAMAAGNVAGTMLNGAVAGKAPKALAGAARFYGDTMKPAPMEMNAPDSVRNEWVRNIDKWRNAHAFANEIDPVARETTAVSGPRMDPTPQPQSKVPDSGVAWGKDVPKTPEEEALRAKAVDEWVAREMGMRQPKTQTALIPGGYADRPDKTGR